MPSRQLSRAIILARLKVYEQCGYNACAASRALKISRNAMQSTFRSAVSQDIPVPVKAPEAPLVSQEDIAAAMPNAPNVLHRLQDKVKRLEAELREVHRDNIDVEDVRKHIFNLAESDPSPPDWLLEPTKADHGWMTAPSTILSDLHISEKVSLSETNGINEYNVEIFKRRLRTYVSVLIDLCFKHAAHPEYPGLVLNLIGDLLSGDIHAELKETNEFTSMQTVLFAVDVLSWAIGALADRFGRIFVIGVPGNHGRNTIKPQAKRYVFQNFDWLICCLLRRHFEAVKDARVRFLIPDSGEALYRVYGWRYLAIHGDDLGVKGGDGIIGSAGPIIRGDIKIRNSNSQIGRDYDFLMLGHWHQQFWFPRVIVNNTMKGFDEFARRMLKAVPSTPSQSLWHTHPDHGIINRQDVFVDKQIPRSNATPWSDPFELQAT